VNEPTEAFDHRKSPAVVVRFVARLCDILAEEPQPQKSPPRQRNRKQQAQLHLPNHAELFLLLRNFARISPQCCLVLLQGQRLVPLLVSMVWPPPPVPEAGHFVAARLNFADCWSEQAALLAYLLRGCKQEKARAVAEGTTQEAATSPLALPGSRYVVPSPMCGGLVPVGFLLLLLRNCPNAASISELAVHMCWESHEGSRTMAEMLGRALEEHCHPGPATRQIHVLLQIVGAVSEMQDSLSRKRAIWALSTSEAAFQRFINDRAAVNARWISPQELAMITEAAGALVKLAKESPFPYIHDWFETRRDHWVNWQRQMKREMQKAGGSTSGTWLESGSSWF